ncbi:FMN-binding protein [Ignavigranum ruoffiae]|uniref:FMN-binding protein n=1 Tax=Ignavigranum ruoffiae TaxID=89093 RepID=UPI002044F403|nr:FMN-binding protein [Ignavigranum ruoffiae]UPQ85279.1 FMN-binding protein [Ignavigranum ruoffiae]
MKISKSLLKGSLLLSSVLLLSACADNTQKEETTVAEESSAAVVKDTTMEETETSVEETRAASESEESEESKDESEESKDESEESMDESEESKDESEESMDESEESKDESEESMDKSEESKDESEESMDESEESKDESEESMDETEESKDESEESMDESEESKDESEESMDESEESKEAAGAVAMDAELQDGEYKAVSNEDEHGWSVEHTIVVKDGKVTESKFDYVNAEGKLKSEDEEYNKNMKDKTGVSGAEAMEALNAALVDNQSADVDVVSGATSTSETFKFSSQMLLKAAAEGNTEEINLDELPLQDGEFTAKGEVDEHGWSPMMTMVVKDGKITEVTYDYENAEGKLKSEDEEYNKNMEDKTGVSAAEAMEELSAALVEKQKVEEVDVVSGATSTSEEFMNLAKQLIKESQMKDSKDSEDESSSDSESSESEDTDKSEESTTEKESSEESSEESSN